MKKDVWKYGLVSGLALAITMAITVPFEHHTSARWGMAVGYTIMVLSFLIVFVGVKHYRDTERGGSITFGRIRRRCADDADLLRLLRGHVGGTDGDSGKELRARVHRRPRKAGTELRPSGRRPRGKDRGGP